MMRQLVQPTGVTSVRSEITTELKMTKITQLDIVMVSILWSVFLMTFQDDQDKKMTRHILADSP